MCGVRTVGRIRGAAVRTTGVVGVRKAIARGTEWWGPIANAETIAPRATTPSVTPAAPSVGLRPATAPVLHGDRTTKLALRSVRRPTRESMLRSCGRAGVRLPMRWRLVLAAVAGVAAVAACLLVLHGLESRARSAAHSDVRREGRAVVDALERELADARTRAVQVAADPRVGRALAAGTRVPAAAAPEPRIAILDAHGHTVLGRPAPEGFAARAVVAFAGGRQGTVVVRVPIARLARSLPPGFGVTESVRLRQGEVAKLDGAPVGRRGDIYAVGVTPRSMPLAVWTAASAYGVSTLALALVVLGGVCGFAAVALPLLTGGRRERDVAPETLRLFGEALAAAHEPEALLSSFLRLAVEATGAPGGALHAAGREIERLGSYERPDLRIPLRVVGASEVRELLLSRPRGGFRHEALERVEALALRVTSALMSVQMHELARERAETDDLTSLANRRSFSARFETAVASARSNGASIALIAADLDEFKRINDRFGHAAGDVALRHFAGIVALHTREEDLAARVGGDEFMVLMPLTDLQSAVAVAERIRTATAASQLVSESGGLFTLTASFGVVASHRFSDTSSLLARADDALYAAKAAGRNRVVVVPGR